MPNYSSLQEQLQGLVEQTVLLHRKSFTAFSSMKAGTLIILSSNTCPEENKTFLRYEDGNYIRRSRQKYILKPAAKFEFTKVKRPTTKS